VSTGCGSSRSLHWAGLERKSVCTCEMRCIWHGNGMFASPLGKMGRLPSTGAGRSGFEDRQNIAP
jgi:hypothetical protein